MSFQRPNIVAGPSSASYSEFLKDIYSSLRNLTVGLNLINQRLDNLQQQFQSFDARLENQDKMAQNLANRIDTLIQQTESQQIRQTTNGMSLLSELDNLGARQVEPSTGLAELGLRTDKFMSSASWSSKLSFQLSGLPETPDIIILEPAPTKDTSTEQQLDEPSTTTTEIKTNSGIHLEPVDTKPQLGTNFLILD
jgi:hypothetical protein